MAIIASKAYPKKWNSKSGGHAEFRQKLATSLMSRFDRAQEHQPRSYVLKTRRTQLPILEEPCGGELIRLPGKHHKYCKICQANGADRRRRKPLEEASSSSLNARRLVPRTHFGCSVCNIYICKQKGLKCWTEHIAASIGIWEDE